MWHPLARLRAVAKPGTAAGHQPTGRRRIFLIASLIGLLAADIVLALRGYPAWQISVMTFAAFAGIGYAVFGSEASWRAGLGLFLVAPLFFRMGAENLVDMPETFSRRLGGQTLPFSGVILALVVTGLALNGRLSELRCHRALGWALAGFVLTGLAVLALGALVPLEPPRFSTFIQIYAPLAGLIAGLVLVRSGSDAAQVVRFVKWSLLASCLILLAQNLAVRDPVELFSKALIAKIGPLNIYQENDYVPFVFGAALVWVVLHEICLRPLSLRLAAFAFVVGLTIFGLHSRGVVLFVAAALMLALLAAPRASRRRVVQAALLFLAIYATGTLLGVPAAKRTNEIVSNAATVVSEVREPSGALQRRDRSTWARFKGATKALDYLADKPLTGSRFSRTTTVDRSSPHNQYLDIAFRGGLVLLAGFLGLLVTVLVLIGRAARHPFSPEAAGSVLAAISVFAGTVVAGNLFQHNFSQPLSGFFVWFLAGAGLSLTRREETESGDKT